MLKSRNQNNYFTNKKRITDIGNRQLSSLSHGQEKGFLDTSSVSLKAKWLGDIV